MLNDRDLEAAGVPTSRARQDAPVRGAATPSAASRACHATFSACLAEACARLASRHDQDHTRSSKHFRVALKEEERFAATDGESASYARAGNLSQGPAGSPGTAEGNRRVLNVEDQLLRFHGEGASIGIKEYWVNWVGDAQAGRSAIAGAACPGAFIAGGDHTYEYRGGSGAAPAPAPEAGPAARGRDADPPPPHFDERSSAGPIAGPNTLINTRRTYDISSYGNISGRAPQAVANLEA